MKSKLRMLLETIGQVLVGAVTKGELLTDDPTIRKRLTVCSKCPELEDNLACKACGCRVAYKARLKAAKCPKNKW